LVFFDNFAVQKNNYMNSLYQDNVR